MPILGAAAWDMHATLHDCTLVYDTHDTVRYYKLRNHPCGASRHDMVRVHRGTVCAVDP